MVVAWQLGDDGAGHGREAGGRKMGEPRRQWWSTKWLGDSVGCCGERLELEGRGRRGDPEMEGKG